MVGLKIPELKKMTLDGKINVFNKPNKVYIPLINQDDTDLTIIVKKGDYVLKGTIIAKRKGNFRIPIHSSVSGVVVDFEEHLYLNGQKIKSVVIENDFKEKVEKRINTKKYLTEYDRDEFLEIIKEAGIVGMGGGGFPTYIKYTTNEKIKTLIVNAIESEPYNTSDYALIVNKTEEMLEAIDAIIEINNIDEAIIAIPVGSDLKKHLTNFIGTYLKVKVVEVPRAYPMGWERYLIKQLKNESYYKLPIEKGIVVNNVSTIYAIYEALKYDRPLTERVVTFDGDALNKPTNVLIKIGTPIKDVIESIGGYKDTNDIRIVAGGPMMGKAVVNDELVVTPNLTSVLVFNYQENIPQECINCGKCVTYCPVKISPVLVMKNIQNKKKLSHLEPLKCTECGLCSYVCPSKIPVREYVTSAKKKVVGE
jgi:electron transport complex protein RnfC